MNSAIFHPNQLIAQGRYRIDRLLGEGGMGVVYEATELTLERKVALKVLLPELSQHPTARQRMEAEAKAMARLNSPHVVRVNTVFDEGGLLVIDLEFMGGGSLADRLDGRGVDEATAREWISQILKGLDALHKVGLVHRDLKPANVLLDEHGVLKVTDLGIAQDSQRTGGLKTRHDANLGTAEYMAPEQVQSAATVDARADVYAAGVMLYEFLTGRVPFSGEDWAVKAAQVKEEPDLEVVRAKSPALGAVVERALAKGADKRWQSAGAMAGALSDVTVPAAAPVPPVARVAAPVLVSRFGGESVATRVELPRTAGGESLAAGPAVGVWVRIEPGTFTMGSPGSEEGHQSDETQHQVTITRGFWLKTTEVTQGEWTAVMGSKPSKNTASGSTCPVEQVSWSDAVAYCNKLSERENLQPCYVGERFVGLACTGYRLPTEAEWEYAARAGATGARHGEVGAVAWYNENSNSTTHPVGQKQANAWGLYDMLGNVWEWTNDWSAGYSGAARDPVGPDSGRFRVIRGGGWNSAAVYVRSALRDGRGPGYRDGFIGFRPARSVP
jgi:formylglycine-generating enzyme required for sulfatase activity